MKTTIGALKSAIKKALKAAHTDSCAISVKDGSLKIMGSSFEGCVMVNVPSEGMVADCSATINSKQVGAILGSVSDSTSCTIKALESTGLSLSFAGARIKLVSPFKGDVEDMFDQPQVTGTRRMVFETTGSEIAALLSGPLSYAARSDVRTYLVSVYAQADHGILRLTGTDGHKLCTCTSEIATSVDMEDCILPLSVAEAVHTVFEADERFTVEQLGESTMMRLLLTSSRTQWLVTLIAGKYPEWKRVMPQPIQVAQITLGREALAAAVNRVLAASGNVCAVLIFSDKGLKVESTDGEQQEFFAGQTTALKNHRIGITGKLLIDAVMAVETPTVVIGIDGNDPKRSKIVFKPVDAKITDWIGFMMPATV